MSASAATKRDHEADLSATVARFIAGLNPDAIPAVAYRAAALSLLDAVGVSLAASGLGEGCAEFAQLVLDEGGRADATVIGFGGRVPAASAALANGSMSHALDFEDSIDGVAVHPHAQVIPAVLALAEERDLDGRRLVGAIAVGCDITVRLGRATGEALAERGWYPPPILGGLGASAACAFLVGLGERQVRDALSLALSQITASGEIKNSPSSVLRGVRDGFAAHAAVRSVQLAERGIRGFDRPLEGEFGFFATFAGGAYDPAAVVDDLGQRWAGVETSFKSWPSCRGTHAFVQAALEARARVNPAQISEVTLLGAPVNAMLAHPLEAKRRPTTSIDAKFSLPFTVATALVTGGVTLESFAPSRLGDAAVLDMARRIRFVSDDSGRFGMTAGRMSVVDASGEATIIEVQQPRGNPADPIPVAELRTKFVSCAAEAVTGFSRDHAGVVADDILAADDAAHVRERIAGWLAA